MSSWDIGKHNVEFRAPDFFCIHVKGAVQEHEVKEALRLLTVEMEATQGNRVFFIVDVRDVSGNPLSSEARKYISTAMPPTKAVIVVGASPLMRAVTTMISHGLTLLMGRKIPLQMAASMEHADKYMDEMRAQESMKV